MATLRPPSIPGNGRPEPSDQGGNGNTRAIWIAVITLFSLFAATAAGVLTHLSGANIAAAILTAGTTFAGAVALALAVAHYLHGTR